MKPNDCVLIFQVEVRFQACGHLEEDASETPDVYFSSGDALQKLRGHVGGGPVLLHSSVACLLKNVGDSEIS